MHPFFTPYRGHAIFAIPAGLGDGPFSALYSCWRHEPASSNYQAVLQGSEKGTYATQEAAYQAALTAAKLALDQLLDK